MNKEKETNQSELKKNVIRQYIQLLSIFLFTAAILLISAGSIHWLWAWVYLGIFLVHNGINSLVLSKELLAERGKKKENVKKWDRLLTRLGILPALAVPVIAGLDERFSWSTELPMTLHLAGLAIYILGDVIVSWSMAANQYFSTMVRIQDDREHQVASNGPYSLVRHPGYVGIILNTLSTPFLLGSYWALVPAILVALLFIIRTHFEDQTLQNELPGYSQYAQKVRSRLIPGLW